MRPYGIDLTGRRAKHFDEFVAQRFDYVVTLCDQVREICPQFPGPSAAVHWSMPNPAEAAHSHRATHPAFEATARELDERIRYFIPLLATKERRTHA
jgi:protein-tyrosine-phosphatase